MTRRRTVAHTVARKQQAEETLRITPMQAQRLVEKLQARDQMVAMVQDEVNAILASHSVGACDITGGSLDGGAPFLTIVRKTPTA